MKVRLLGIVAAVAMAFASPASATPADEAAHKLFETGDFVGAAAAYAALLQENAHDVAAEIGLGSIRLYQNDLTGAQPLLQAAVAAEPANARAAGLLAELKRRQAEAAKKTVVNGNEAEVPFVTADPLPVIEANVNGTAGQFLIDTGATVELQPAFAQRVKLQGGTASSIVLGSATAYDVSVRVVAHDLTRLFPNQRIDGIIGTTLFERFLATIDYPRHVLILQPDTPQVSQRFEAAAEKAHSSIVPCWLVGDHEVFAAAQVNEADPGLFYFDSGLAGGGLIPSPDLVRLAGLKVDPVKPATFVAEKIIVGTAVQNNVVGFYDPRTNPFGVFPFEAWGIVSDLFLRHYAYTVDFNAMKIVLGR
jgi:hypothetical protein